MHSENHNYTEPQYRLWARMVQNGIHTSKDSPPQVPMITGAIPGNKKKKAPAFSFITHEDCIGWIKDSGIYNM